MSWFFTIRAGVDACGSSTIVLDHWGAAWNYELSHVWYLDSSIIISPHFTEY
jgi:hypothetical protein